MKYTRQIKALKATEEKMWKEWNLGEIYYNFCYESCPLCNEFTYGSCKGCPFNKFKSRSGRFSCLFCRHAVRLDHAISFIMQMRMFYEEFEQKLPNEETTCDCGKKAVIPNDSSISSLNNLLKQWKIYYCESCDIYFYYKDGKRVRVG